MAARHAIASHLERIGVQAQVDFGPPGLYRVTHQAEPSSSVDLVLAVEQIAGLGEAAASWLPSPTRAGP